VYDHTSGAWGFAEVLSRNTAANTITISVPHFSHRTIARDHDGDGCADNRELGSDQTIGGLREPFDPNDYYDVLGPNQSLPADQIVDLANDILSVIQHYAPQGQTPPYEQLYDRGPQAGPNPWNLGPPDGVIDLPNDILGVILQYLHDCR
jgi:hypothetical protein